MSKLKYLILFSFCLFFDNCLGIKGYQSLILYELSSKYVGKKGTLVINLSSITDVEEDTKRTPFFNVNLSNGKSVECGVWIPGKYKSYIFCNIGTDIPAGNYTLNFENIQFTYKDWVISFQNSRKYEFEKLDKELIDLYSNKQTIYIVEGEDSYKLNFNLVSYNQEAVILQTLGLVFMDCEQGNSELICKIKKHDLEKGLNKKVFSTKVYFLSDIANLGFSELPLVGDITIIDNITEKVDVFVGITRLLENVAEGSSNIAFETNVTNINKVITGSNNNKVSFINEYGTTEKAGCSLRKYDDHPLFIICYLPNIGKCWLKEIKEEITFNEANIRYNFRIQPFKNEEKIYHSGEDKGSSIRWLYPEILDFTKNDILYVDYNSTSSRYIKGITFNKDKGDLSCEERQNKLLRCKVLKNHFEKTGYYFTRHSNHLDGKSTYYESPPVKVILKGNIYSIPFYYSLLLILIMF